MELEGLTEGDRSTTCVTRLGGDQVELDSRWQAVPADSASPESEGWTRKLTMDGLKTSCEA